MSEHRMRLACVLLAALGLPQWGWGATTVCDEFERKVNSEISTEMSLARTQFGQAVALFEAKLFRQSQRGFQAALFSGLTDELERATALKYLAFMHCAAGEFSRCEQAFDEAFQVYPPFSLYAFEATTTPWRDSYGKVYSKWARTCGWTDRSRPSVRALSQTYEELALSAGLGEGEQLVTALAPRRQAKSAKTIFQGNVRLRVWPWAHVRVDGKEVGLTPPVMRMHLKPGIHVVELRNPGFKSVRYPVNTASLSSEEVVTLQHDFDTR